MILKYYKLIMDSRHNALSNLPVSTRFQLMSVLSWMWSVIFSLGIGSYYVFGLSVVFHILVLLGVFATYVVFERHGK